LRHAHAGPRAILEWCRSFWSRVDCHHPDLHRSIGYVITARYRSATRAPTSKERSRCRTSISSSHWCRPLCCTKSATGGWPISSATHGKENHRLTLNPMRHIDPFGTVLLPCCLLISACQLSGTRNPCRVNVSRLRKPRFAGPLRIACGTTDEHLPLAIGLGITSTGSTCTTACSFRTWGDFGLANLVLAAFNLIPIPPLDDRRSLKCSYPVVPALLYQHARKGVALRDGVVAAQLRGFPRGLNALTDLERWWIGLL